MDTKNNFRLYDQCHLHYPIFNHQTSFQFEDANTYAQKSHNQVMLNNTTKKFQADHFPCLFLKIGAFEAVARNKGDLVAKCYYSREKLIWEILYDGLMSKIEISWQDILAMRAILQENEPGILELELSQPPKFFQETNSKPRQKTHWESTSDFTGGYASQYRIHHVRFSPGALDKYYNNLLRRDDKFFQLSQRPFPSLASPYYYNLNPPFPHHQYHQLGSSTQSSDHIASQGHESQNFGENSNMDDILCIPTEPTMPIHVTSQAPSTTHNIAVEDEFAFLDSLSNEEFANILADIFIH